MSRKHYKAIAAMLARRFDALRNSARAAGRKDIPPYVAADNPRFNRAEFLEACRQAK